MYILFEMPGMGEVKVTGVTVTAVHDDGTFDATGDGWQGNWCSPESHRLFDNNNHPVNPAAPVPLTEVELLRQRLDIQDAVLQELLFTIIPKMTGGGSE